VKDKVDLYWVHRLKTAVLLGCALETGAIIAGASVEDAKRIREVEIIWESLSSCMMICLMFMDKQKIREATRGDLVSNKKNFSFVDCSLRFFKNRIERITIIGFQSRSKSGIEGRGRSGIFFFATGNPGKKRSRNECLFSAKQWSCLNKLIFRR